jgi:hypothetical protein
MKKIILLACLALPLLGCPAANTTTPATALAPGFSSQADQTMDQVLVGAHTFYTTVQQDIASGKYTPSASEKVALNTFATALNTAQTIYINFHNGTATQAQAQTAVNNLQTQQTALQSTITAVN